MTVSTCICHFPCTQGIKNLLIDHPGSLRSEDVWLASVLSIVYWLLTAKPVFRGDKEVGWRQLPPSAKEICYIWYTPKKYWKNDSHNLTSIGDVIIFENMSIIFEFIGHKCLSSRFCIAEFLQAEMECFSKDQTFTEISKSFHKFTDRGNPAETATIIRSKDVLYNR